MEARIRTRTRAGSAVTHGTAVTPAGSKELALVNAEVVLEHSNNLVGEGDILATVVGPTGVQAVGGNKDGAVTGQLTKTIEATAGNIVHGAITPVVSNDDTVLLVAVVVVGQLEDVLSLPAVDGHGLGARGRGRLAAAGGLGLDRLGGGEEGESEGADGDHVD